MNPVSLVYFERVLDQLRDAHPRHTYIDFRDVADTRRRHGKNLGNIIAMLERKEVDIVFANACEIPLRLNVHVAIAAVPDRGNPFDVLVAREELILDEQPEHMRLAVTDQVSGLQLLYYRPDLVLRHEKAGVDFLNRLMKDGEVDGFVISATEIEAFNQQDRVVEVFTSSVCTPMAGQGAVGLITRKNDKDAQSAVNGINDPSSLAEVELERMFLATICRDSTIPIGVLAKMEGNTFEIEVAVTSPDGTEKVTGALDGIVGQEKEVTGMLAGELLSSVGKRIIEAYR